MAEGRRTRSLDRGMVPENLLGRLTEALEGLSTNQRATRRGQFKAPQYKGEGDVDYFIQQFEEVAMANEWDRVSTLLYLREALQDGAQDCGRADTPEGVFNALRVRYGLTTREARNRLSTLKRDTRCTLAEHAVEVSRLARRAYADMPEPMRREMTLDVFCGSLNHAGLQRHLLATQPQDMEQAVQQGSEYLQVRGSTENKIRSIDEEEHREKVAVADTNPLSSLMKAVEQLTLKIEQLSQPAVKKTSKTQKCWGCQKEGHNRRECPTHPWPKQATNTQSGNGASPQ